MKVNNIIYRQKALEDIAETVQYLAMDNPNVAKFFRKCLEETLDAIATMPGIGSQRHYKDPDLANVRFVPMKKFEKHLVFFHVSDNNLHIIRIVHGARNLPTLFQ